MRRIIPLVLLTACVQQTGPGPDLGACAEVPSGSYTFGEPGIGTCLASPSDVLFFEQAGQTYLAVANANASLNFQTGSLLVLDWSSVQEALDAGSERLIVSDLRAGALAKDDYLSGLSYLPGSQVLLAAGRLSPDATVNTNPDAVWALDLSEPLAPVPLASGSHLRVGADPAAIVADPATGLAYAINSTDGSVSVIQTDSTPMEVLDLGDRPRFTPARFIDADVSGSHAEIAHEVASTDGSLASDDWTLSWVDASYRAWVPSPGGLSQHTSGGVTWVTSPLGGLEAVGAVQTPRAITLSGIPAVDFALDGVLYRATYDAQSGDLVASSTPLLSGSPDSWMAQVRSPSALLMDQDEVLFFEGVDAAGQSAVGMARWLGDAPYRPEPEPVLTVPEGYERLADPFVVMDTRTGTLRLWASLWDGARWSIGHAESEDGLSWTPLTEQLALPAGHAAAPVVTWANGRYQLWLATSDGTTWEHASAWSWDGASWSTPEPVLASELDFDLHTPPRVAMLVQAQGAWTLEGQSRGTLSTLATAGTPYIATDDGMSFSVASGYELSFTSLSGDASGGISPGSVLSFGGQRWLFATATDALGDSHIASFVDVGGTWQPNDPNITAGQSPVVFVQGSLLHMVLARTNEFGVTRMIHGTSIDGHTWVFDTEPLFPSTEDFDSFAQLPHSAQSLADGTVRIWYTGHNGSRSRIAAVVGPVGGPFTLDRGAQLPWQLDAGLPGAFDDVDVADPMVFRDGELEHLWYAGYDGDTWSIGHATRPLDGVWERATGTITGQARTFSHAGVRAPVVSFDANGWELLYAGDDGTATRIGRGIGTPERFFAAQAFPTVGDSIAFGTRRGGTDQAAIPLSQRFDGMTFRGIGASHATLDDERGLLWVTNRLWNTVTAIDVRDDSSADFDDRNYLDIEAVLLPGTTPVGRGLRDAVIPAGTSTLYASARLPDQVLVYDLSGVVDDSRKDVLLDTQLGALPVQAQRTPTQDSTTLGVNGQATSSNMRDEDNGEATSTLLDAGAMGMALTADQRTLLVTHFRENKLIAFDLQRGPWGEEIRQIDNIGENPHRVITSPDGRYAVVANYVGEVRDGVVGGTLAIVDLDPASPTYLTVVAHVVNQ